MFTALCSFTAMAQVPNYVPTNGLAAWYSFSGNANDLSGNNNNGTVTGATLTTDRFGSTNSAYSYNGTSSFINVLNSATLQFNGGLTLSAWLYPTSLPTPTSYFLSKGADGGTPNSWNAYVSGTQLAGVAIYDNTGINSLNITSNTTIITTNQWVNVVFTFDGGNIANCYVNGQLVYSMPFSYTVFSNTYDIKFGKRYISGLPYYWNGKIDDAGIWNRALTQCEVQELYTSSSVNAPTASITPQSSTTFCTGGFVNLNANTGTGYTYQWYNNNVLISGATNSTYTANQGGSYTVVVNNSGCTATSTAVAVTVNTAPNSGVTVSGATTICSGNSVTLTAQGTGTYLWSNNATSNAITVTQTGNYSVTVTANGCSATSGITAITVNQTPTASITPVGATTFCQGGFVTLNASGGGTYQWNTGATSSSINANQSNTYSVIVTSNGCSATASQTVTVNPNPTVTLGALSNFTNINAAPVTLSGSPSGGTYIGAGVSGTTFNPNTAGLGTHYIHYNYTTGAGCSGSATQSTIVYDTTGLVCTTYDTLLTSVTDTLIIHAVLTGVNPPNNTNTIKVYPNPASDHIYINNGNYATMAGYSCTITNALSQQVFYSLINQQQFYISLSTWTGHGIYFLTIRNAANSVIEVKKIVIQ